jgi:hypothetical protein
MPENAIRTGDRDGLGTVYSLNGGLLTRTEEQILRMCEDWDLTVKSIRFSIFGSTIYRTRRDRKTATYITNDRIVMLQKSENREFDPSVPRPLGQHFVAHSRDELRAGIMAMKEAEIRHYCSIEIRRLRASVITRKVRRERTLLKLRVEGKDGSRFVVKFWKDGAHDAETIDLILHSFRK